MGPSISSIWPPYAGAKWVFPSCQAYPQFPDLSSTAASYGEAQSPALQAEAIRGFAFGGGWLPEGEPSAAYGIMDSSEADFYGLNDANLENPGGNFAAPSTANIESALNDITPCPTNQTTCMANTYTFDYTSTSNPDSYPMPDITYTVVPTAPQPAATATAMKSLLTDLVTYSHSGGTIPLPAGYVPLPTDLYITALSEISSAITTQSAAPTGSTTSPRHGGVDWSSEPRTAARCPARTDRASCPSEPLRRRRRRRFPFRRRVRCPSTRRRPREPPPRRRRAPVEDPVGPATPTAVAFVSFDTVSRLLLPLIVLLALACLIAGPLLLLGPGARRRRSEAGSSSDRRPVDDRHAPSHLRF